MRLPAEDLQNIFSVISWHHLSNKSILVTGGTGFIGRWLIESFLLANRELSLGARLFVVSRKPSIFKDKYPHLNDAALQFIEGDVSSFTFPQGDFDFVIHAAGDVGVPGDDGSFGQVLDSGYCGTKHVLQFCTMAKVKKYLLVSSGAAYGAQPSDIDALDEEYRGAPIVTQAASAYGEAKRVAEWLSFDQARRTGLEVKVARCFGVIGPGLPLDGHFAAGNFFAVALKKQCIRIDGDGTSIRSFMYAGDLTAWLWKILFEAPALEVYNVGSEKAVTIRQLAEQIVIAEGSGLRIEVAGGVNQGLASPRYLPSIRKATSAGLRAQVDFAHTIKKTFDYYRQQDSL